MQSRTSARRTCTRATSSRAACSRRRRTGRGVFLDAREALGARFAENSRPSMQAAAPPASTRRCELIPGRAGRALPYGRHRGRRTWPHARLKGLWAGRRSVVVPVRTAPIASPRTLCSKPWSMPRAHRGRYFASRADRSLPATPDGAVLVVRATARSLRCACRKNLRADHDLACRRDQVTASSWRRRCAALPRSSAIPAISRCATWRPRRFSWPHRPWRGTKAAARTIARTHPTGEHPPPGAL